MADYERLSLKERQLEAARWLAAKRLQTPCVDCGRMSGLRVGERKPRRPLDFFPYDGARRPWGRLIEAGVAVEVLKLRMSRCVPLCRTCADKRRAMRR